MLILNDLVETLVEMTGCRPAQANDFLRELFALASENLETQGRVEIPLLGTFTVKDSTIQFQPDSALAAEVNNPFADFAPIEVPEGFSLGEEQLDAEEPEAAIEAADEVVEVEEVEEVEEHKVNEDSDADNAADMPEIPVKIPPYNPSVVSEAAQEPEEPRRRRDSGCCRLALIGLICIILGFIAGWFVAQYYSPRDSEPVIELQEPTRAEETDLSELPDSIVTTEVSEVIEPVDSPRPIVTDTVRVGRYLTTMAYQHYGQKEYWVYIYEANKQYGNPNTLAAGTVVIIPPADSLGLVPGDPEKMAEAHSKLNEIWLRFN